MPDIAGVFSRWWKRIAAFTAVATGVAVAIVLLLPPTYVSTATALPASSFAADKSTVFNSNIQQLYSSLGTADDLDRIIGTARLDTIYIATVARLGLASHYGMANAPNSEQKAAQKLKQQSSISKSEWGELKVKVWDGDRTMAATAANALLERLQSLHQGLQSRSNRLVLQKLQETYRMLQQHDTNGLHHGPGPAVEAVQREQLRTYDKLLSEYNLMVTANPPVLLVVEPARPALHPDNTKKLAYIVITFFAALLFFSLLAFYTEGKKAV